MGKKGEAQRMRVIESASYCLCNFGERGATFQAIAEHCKISQASVVKYLKNRANIFPTVLNFWISRARDITEEALREPGTAEQKLRRYLQVSAQLFFERDEISKIYLMLHSFASIDERYRVVNTDIKRIAQQRIGELIKLGIQEGSFKEVDAALAAKTIHNTLVGFLVATVTEIKTPMNLQMPEVLERFCLSLVLKPG